MRELEISVDHELFRVRERIQPSGQLSYDFGWINGPADGTYGFTASLGAIDPAEPRARLEEEARRFVETFYGLGGIGETDFPDHVAARRRANNE